MLKNNDDMIFQSGSIIEIARNKDFRIEVNELQKLKIKIIKGLAELKGAELVNNKWYLFTDTKTSIFTFTGCDLEIEGECELAYIGERSNFPKLFDIYNGIVQSKNVKNILILGQGQSTTAITMCNYFIRDQKKILFTELDTSKGNIFPGTLSVMAIRNISINHFSLNNPFCLFYGSKEAENMELYELQMMEISKKAKELIENETDIIGNVVIAPFIDFNSLNKMITQYNINFIIVSKDERLYHRIKPKIQISINFIPNNGFISENKIIKSIKRYFYGEQLSEVNNNFVFKNIFTPSRIILNNKTHSFSIIKVGEDFIAPDSALPIGANRKVGIIGVEDVDLIENSILAISDATDRDEVALKPVVGFLVCLDEKKGRVLSIQPKLPKMNFLIQGNIKYIEY